MFLLFYDDLYLKRQQDDNKIGIDYNLIPNTIATNNMRSCLIIICNLLFTGFLASSQSLSHDSLLLLLEKESHPNVRADYLLQISKSVYEQSHDEYLSYGQKALSETEHPKFDNDTLKMKIINNVGCAYSEINDAQLANQYFFDAVEIAEKIKDQHYLSNLYNNIGLTYGNVQEYDKAIEHHLLSLKIKEQRNDSLGVSISHTNIGAVYYLLKDYDKAKQSFEKSFEISKIISDKEGIAFGYTNLADLLVVEGKHDQALEYYYHYLELVTEMKYNHSILFGHKKIGEIYVGLGELKKAKPHIEKAYEMAKKFNYTWELTNIRLLYANLKQQLGDFDSALVYANEALENIPSSSSKNKLASIHQMLSGIYEKQGNTSMAFHHLKIQQVERDSALQKENMEAFADVEARYQLELKDKENFYLKQEQSLNEKIISQRTLLAIGSMLGALILAILGYRFYRKKETQQRLNLVLEKKVKERTKHLKESNEKLEQANVELERFFHITSHDLKEPLRNIVSFSKLAKRSFEKKDYIKAAEYLHFSERGTIQLETLLRGVMDFFSAGKKEALKNISIYQALEKAKEGLGVFLKEKNPQIIFQSDEDLHQVLFPEQISLVFKNLMDNGIRFNESKTPVISIEVRDTSTEYYFRVKDNGVGISEEYQDQIFEMFKRLNSRDKHLGSGIGLSICKKILQNFDGNISVENSDAEGTVFKFWISKTVCERKAPIEIATSDF